MEHATGKKIVNTQWEVLLEIGKLATTVDVMYRSNVLNDGLVNFVTTI